jgi:hypothetical protein
VARRRAARVPEAGARAAALAAADGGGAVVPGLERIVARIREEEPDAIGVFVFGSHARGTAQATSDLDLQVVTLGRPRVALRTWFAGDLHISVSAKSTAEIRARCAEPADWSLGFAARSPGVWAWSTAAAVAGLGDPPGFEHPPGPPELEDFVESCAKALRATGSTALRIAARGAAERAPALLRDLNAPEWVADRVEAMEAALGYRTAPAGWRDDLAMAWGLTPVSDDEVRAAVERLARGTLALLRERGSHVGDDTPELTRYLHDGTLERHLGFR